MKNLKNLISMLAFVFAMTAAFAFQPKTAELGTAQRWLKPTNCTGSLDEITCSDVSGDLCTSSGTIVVENSCNADEEQTFKFDQFN